MKRIPCPLCHSARHRVFWQRDDYPAIGGKVVAPEKATTIPRLPLEISLCLDCQHIYQSLPPDAGLLDSFYSGSYVSANPSPALGGTPPRGLEPFLRMIRDGVGLRRGRALEIGAYDGYVLHLLEKDGWSATGFEPSEIGGIGRKFFNVDIRHEFYAPGQHGESWDLVVSRYVFEHLPSPREILAGLFSETSLGGWLALEVPDLQTRLQEGILGCFAHEHISYFVPATMRQVVEEAGYEVRRMLNSRDGLAVLAQKPAAPKSRTPSPAKPSTANEALVERFLHRRRQQRENFSRELSRWTGPQTFVIYGADSHTTDLLVEGWVPPEKVRCLIDDDPAKQGLCAAGFSISVVSRAQLPAPGEALIILSAFGHHDRLWENLAEWRSRGGAVLRFYPECEFVPSGL
jgi:hypothetical protein